MFPFGGQSRGIRQDVVARGCDRCVEATAVDAQSSLTQRAQII